MSAPQLRTPRTDEVWKLKTDSDQRAVVMNVYPDCLTYRYEPTGDVMATTLADFGKRYEPPAPTFELVEDVWYGPVGFYVTKSNMTQLPDRQRVGSVARMSDGTFRVVAQ